MDTSVDNFLSRVNQIHRALGIPAKFAIDRKLPLHREAQALVPITSEGSDKTHKLTPATANAWNKMNNVARAEGISLIMVSGYRGLEYQRALIEKKLQKGQAIEEILSLLAPPGYSEHHTGTAIDLTTEHCPPCVERFEKTDAFKWLEQNAGNFDFTLSYPRDNPFGFVYEPWHWSHTD